MKRLTPLLLLLAAPLLAEDLEVSRENLERHVATLASPQFRGRRGEGAKLAEEYVARAFREAGLRVEVQEASGVDGRPVRNVIGILPAGEKPTSEHVILSAHYDHLGAIGKAVFPGAADNAAGVAALLELARTLKRPLRRDILFVAFDQEEVGLVGSCRYAEKPLRPLSECAAFLTIDILGRDLADATEGILFCCGLEHSDGLFEPLRDAGKAGPLFLAFTGADIVGSRSDYAAFRDAKVPFVFFSAGEFLDYHTPADTPDKVRYDKLLQETRLIRVASRAMAEAERPRWRDEPACRIEEPASLERVAAQLLAKKDTLHLSGFEAGLAGAFHVSLQQVVRTGRYTPEDRRQLVQTSQAMAQMLQGKR